MNYKNKMSKTDWRQLYKDKWKDGVDRVLLIQKLFLRSNTNLVIKDGFMCKSTQMLLSTPTQHQCGSPDFSVWENNKCLFNVEVTGSDINIGDDDLWVRPDKVNWSIEHPNPPTWIFFVYNDKIFSLNLNLVFSKYPIETKNLKGVPEEYYIIPQLEAKLYERVEL